ncbi:GTP-binding protein [Rhodobacter sp. KR11]|uniref:CobW family GTP-binding protein n=1 Tax=Rhodobacter sp. KR11 TaxID=2974588 RepID=UPI002221A8B7|nr:CobW family GTP-binding protein [Rhodobacter sp. KR11]MCW1920742.1 GTP-binding protein [Rhodobacter sp. KR11]
MTDHTDPGTRLGLTILGGYLGAGKTTWARHQLHLGAFGPGVHVLVNEAAHAGVDDQLLPGPAQDVTLLAGGCACCIGLPRLIASLRDLCDRRSAGRHDLGHILLETSGLADPGAIARALAADPVLTRHLRITAIITLVDAQNGLDQLARDARFQAQVAAADRLILTKTETAPPRDLATLCAALSRLNPAVPPEAAHLGQPHPLPDLPPPGPLPLLADGVLDLTLVELDLPPVNWTRFALWLSALLHLRGEGLVRVKGLIPGPDGTILLQAVHRHVQPPEILPPQDGPGHIVLFGQGLDAATLTRALQRFATA